MPTYTTNFTTTENPISENGNWINGKVAGNNWCNVRVISGVACGTQVGNAGFDDSTALLTGVWGPDQVGQATVFSKNQGSSYFEEVEIRLRSSITPNVNKGYEFNFRCTNDGSQYAQIVRWNGVSGDYTILNATAGPGIHSGDIVKAVISGITLTSYINGVQIVSWTDSTYASGNPGIGFYLQNGTTSQNTDYGFTSYTVTDGIIVTGQSGAAMYSSYNIIYNNPGTISLIGRR